jgi:hypothetical protein
MYFLLKKRLQDREMHLDLTTLQRPVLHQNMYTPKMSVLNLGLLGLVCTRGACGDIGPIIYMYNVFVPVMSLYCSRLLSCLLSENMGSCAQVLYQINIVYSNRLMIPVVHKHIWDICIPLLFINTLKGHCQEILTSGFFMNHLRPWLYHKHHFEFFKICQGARQYQWHKQQVEVDHQCCW